MDVVEIVASPLDVGVVVEVGVDLDAGLELGLESELPQPAATTASTTKVPAILFMRASFRRRSEGPTKRGSPGGSLGVGAKHRRPRRSGQRCGARCTRTYCRPRIRR
jgi:hypothetical protein